MIAKSFLSCLLLLSLLPSLGNCTHLRQLVGLVAEKPVVKLAEIEVEAFAIDRIKVVFILNVHNPNDFSLDIDALDYRVRGHGVELGEGNLAQPLLLAAHERSLVRLPFSVQPEIAYHLFKKFLAQPGELKLRLDARMFMNTAFGKLDMHFQEERTMVKGLKSF